MKIRSTLRSIDPRSLLLNIVLGALGLLVIYLGYSLLERQLFRPPVEVAKNDSGSEIIQIDVLNGCGIPGAATTVRDYLRARGYDVVEMRNYKSFDVDRSLVVDRTGDTRSAERVAYALGIGKSEIIHQINPDYFVDVSVIIGKDFKSLKTSP
jgi:hypothetical protein